MEVEAKLAQVLNIPVKSDDVLSPTHYEHPAYMPSVMQQ